MKIISLQTSAKWFLQIDEFSATNTKIETFLFEFD